MPTPERTSAAAFTRYTGDRPVQDSATLHWDGLFVRRYRFPCVVERFLVPATPEPLVSCGLAGAAEFQERDPGGEWITRRIGPGHIFVTRSRTPYEVEHRSRPGEELETVQVHVAVEPFLAALEEAHPGHRSSPGAWRSIRTSKSSRRCANGWICKLDCSRRFPPWSLPRTNLPACEPRLPSCCKA